MRLYKSKDMCAEWAAPIFEENGWRWKDENNVYYVPVKKEILDKFKSMEIMIREEYLDWCESGRLVASKVIDTGDVLFGIDIL